MSSVLLLALALVIRSIPATDGAVGCPLAEGQRVLDAYSAEFEPIWHHGVQATIVDRTAAARTGRVAGLGPLDRLVLAVLDERQTFDATRPVPDPNAVSLFPYSDEIVAEYRRLTGRDYLRDMMVVVAPNLGTVPARMKYVSNMYDAYFAVARQEPSPVRSFGPAEGRRVLVVTSRSRSLCWLDENVFGDDGTAYARRMAEKGLAVDLAEGLILSRLTVDADGWIVLGARRYETLVLRHVSFGDGERYREAFGKCLTGPSRRTIRTKIFATDTPVLFGAEFAWTDPELAEVGTD